MKTKVSPEGGIDFKPDKVDGAFAVRKDPSDPNGINFTQSKQLGLLLQQLQNATGFVPVIINIQPMTDLGEFLGVTPPSPSGPIGP